MMAVKTKAKIKPKTKSKSKTKTKPKTAIKVKRPVSVSEKPVKELGILKAGTRKIHLVALPTSATSVVVNYSSHEMRVSCAIPAEKQSIAIKDGYDIKKYSFKTLPTILTAEYSDFPKYGRTGPLIKHFYLFAHNTRVKNSISAAPYLISNVYKNGRVCFGNLRPSNLREGYNYFWNSTFNNELHEEHVKAVNYYGINNLVTYIKTYHDTIFMDQPWDDFTGFVCGRKFWAAPQGADALLFSSNSWILKQVPEKFWRRNIDGYPFVLALATKKNKCWEIDGGAFKFLLSERNVTTQKSYHRKCQALKKKFMQPK